MSTILERLSINTELVQAVLVNFLREEIHKVGFQRAVIGLSGGIDSAVSCALAAQALGPQNVLAVLMPYRTSSPASEGDARAVAEAFGVTVRKIEITPMVEPYLQANLDLSNVRRGNVMARTRMIVLYDQSEAFKGLVVGTSNKTELLLGYGTLFGDMASALNPIGDLYKTQIRQLARALGVPAAVIDKPPTADLWAGQTDETELGVTYELADQILYMLVDERQPEDSVIAAGFNPAVVRGLNARIRGFQFKRALPLIAKVSGRTIGADFLYTRDWGR
ncbi:MAG: NAD+ synthase [Chloroflexi bacterium]|nr:NAD+ synthase [Chloroflexota bacterium]